MFIWLTVLSAGVCAWGLYATARRGEDLWPTTVGVTALVAISPLLVMLVGWAAMRSLNSGMAKAEALNASVELSLALPRPERTEQDGN